MALTILPAIRFVVIGKGTETAVFAALTRGAGYQVDLFSPDPDPLAQPGGHPVAPVPAAPAALRMDDLLGRLGIGADDQIILYGDKSNWWAAYALWVFTLFGHPDVRLLDGGRDKWISDARDVSLEQPEYPRSDYPVVERDDTVIRAFADQVRADIGTRALVDVRSPQEYTGERTHMPDYPEEGALRGGHIPTAVSIPWAKAARQDGRFLPHADLTEVYGGLDPQSPVTAYCRIGERSSHTWFVLTHLLGFTDVKNYDGSWTEWGNTVRAPIVRGEEPGAAPGA